MPTFNDKVRIFGKELGESDTYIDAKVSGYSLDGNIKLVEDVDTSPREWVVPQNNISTWQQKDLLISHSEMPNPDHEIWSIIGQLQKVSSDSALASAQGEINDIVNKLFSESTRAQRGHGPK